MNIEIKEPFASLLKSRCVKLHQKESEFVQRALADALHVDPAELSKPWSTDREDIAHGRQDFASGKCTEWSSIRKRFTQN